MALTVDNKTHPSWTSRPVSVQIDFDASYPTGGEALTPNTLGLEKVDIVLIEPKNGYVFSYDATNEKVLAYYGDYDAVADGALIQVANTTDLSAVTNVRVLAFGR